MIDTVIVRSFNLCSSYLFMMASSQHSLSDLVIDINDSVEMIEELVDEIVQSSVPNDLHLDNAQPIPNENSDEPNFRLENENGTHTHTLPITNDTNDNTSNDDESGSDIENGDSQATAADDDDDTGHTSERKELEFEFVPSYRMKYLALFTVADKQLYTKDKKIKDKGQYYRCKLFKSNKCSARVFFDSVRRKCFASAKNHAHNHSSQEATQIEAKVLTDMKAECGSLSSSLVKKKSVQQVFYDNIRT